METLRARLNRKPIVVAPGVYDAFTALVADAGGLRDALRVRRGHRLHQARAPGHRPHRHERGRRDDHADPRPRRRAPDRRCRYRLRQRAQCVRTVRVFERAGASAIQLEDQDFPKRCGHLDGKVLIPADEMVGKIKAALDARVSSDTLIIARTDAVAVEGFERGDRARRALPRSRRRRAVRRGAADARGARARRAGAARRAAARQHGGRRQDAAPAAPPRSRRSASRW